MASHLTQTNCAMQRRSNFTSTPKSNDCPVTTRFTTIEYAIEEAEFIADQLHETAMIAKDQEEGLLVLTRPQYETPEWSNVTVLEIFNP